MTDRCVHDFVPMCDVPCVGEREFVCAKCGLEVGIGGALANPRTAKDDSYRPDIPLRSTDANVAEWADGIARKATHEPPQHRSSTLSRE